MKGIRCQEFVERVTDFLDAGLDTDAARRFVEHLALCEGCGRYLYQIETTMRLLRKDPARPPPSPL